jgi:hypothetical protein
VTREPQPPRLWPWAILWAILFAVAHGQSPEFYSNQHQYLLHGLAKAGLGHLADDWLAKTQDPTPMFTALVDGLYTVAGTFGLQAVFFVLLGAYFESMRRLVETLPGMTQRGTTWFLLAFVAIHAAVLRVASVWLTGVDYPWYLQAGLAAQYLLGPGLQPSAFGIFLIFSLTAFARGRPVLAAGLAAVAAVMHSTYLLPAGLLTVGYLVELLRTRHRIHALMAGALALAVVLPALAYDVWTFVPDDSGQLQEAQRILAEVRIPHHTVVGNWLDSVAVIQIVIMVAGLCALRRTRLFWPLTIPAVVSAVLSVVQVLTKNDSLALLFPWRFSVVLMPVAVAVLLAKLASRLSDGRVGDRIALALAMLLAIGGIWVTATGRGYRVNEAEAPLLQHVRDTMQPGDVYLVPTKFATLKPEKPTSQSKTFVPPVRTGQTGIPVDLQRFRLATGAPIYIDFKAVPYAPAEVIEWHTRVANCERWYKQRDWDVSKVIDEVRAAGITHVITTADKDVTSRELELVYPDESYRVYRVRKGH